MSTYTTTHDTGSSSIDTHGPGGTFVGLLILRDGCTAIASGVTDTAASGAHAHIKHDFVGSTGVAPAALVQGF